MRTMLSARLTAIVTLLVAALAPAAVSGIQCWQCAAVDGRKCPDNSNMVDSPQVSFILRFVINYGDRLIKAATIFRSYIQAETCRKLTQLRKHISPDPVILLPGARIIAICCKMLSDVRTTHIIPFYGNFLFLNYKTLFQQKLFPKLLNFNQFPLVLGCKLRKIYPC